MNEPPIRILIVDDHLVVRMGLRSMIDAQADMQVVAEAGDGDEALNLHRLHQPDIVLMDLRMPGMAGVEATEQIRLQSPEAHIVILTTYDGDENIYRALQAGARAYFLKNTPKDALLNGLRSVHRGEYCLPTDVAVRLAQRPPGHELTSRELEVLQLIIDGRANKEIATELKLTESTVKNHVNSILSKLNVRDRTQAATTALRRGILDFRH